MKYKLESFIGEAFIYVHYIVGFGFLGFLVYSIIMQQFDAMIVCGLLILCWFINLLRIRKFNTITFDENFIYNGNKAYSFSDVKSIKSGKIKLFVNGQEEILFYNSFGQNNFNLLLKYYESKIN